VRLSACSSPLRAGTITVTAGTTVTWTNDDFGSGEFHDDREDGSFISATFGPGEVQRHV
jgi:plastocyanin